MTWRGDSLNNYVNRSIAADITPEKRAEVKELLDIIDLYNEVILKYCELYDALKQRGLLTLNADLLIAATAIVNNLVLVTRDRDFERLKDLGLKLELRTP